MITEDYVSFETAKLLKEKGLDGPCYKVWESDGDTQTLVGVPWVVNRESVDAAAKQYTYEYNLDSKVEAYLAPTLQMAMKWLRELHNIHIEVRITNHSLSSLIDVPRYYWIIVNAKEVKWMDESTAHKSMSYETFEEACETAIKYCLENLI